MRSINRSIAVVGGGVLGMKIALDCARAGFRVTLYEAAPDLGGLASSWNVGPLAWDRFYHVILPDDHNTLALLDDLGMRDDVRFERATSNFFIDGRLLPFTTTWDHVRFPLPLREKIRLASTLAQARRIAAPGKMERIPLEAWLRQTSGDAVFERIWRPLLRAKLGDAYRDASAAFIWATINRLQRDDPRFGYLRGGYARTFARLGETLRRHGVRVRTGARVSSVERCGDTAHVTSNGCNESYDGAVITLAAPLAAKICPSLTDQERARCRNVRYHGVICTSVVLDRPLGGAYVTNIADESLALTGLIEMSALARSGDLGGLGLLYAPSYVASDSPEFARDDETIAGRTLAAIRRVDPRINARRVIATRVARAAQVFAVPTVGYSDAMPPMTTQSGNIFLCSSAQLAHGTLNVNETLELSKKLLPLVLAVNSPGATYAAVC